MTDRKSGCIGALLGLAVGDAMGHTVDEKNWDEIREDYGPNGLLGYDLVNGCAAGSSYTQVAAFVANGLLLAVTRGKPELYLSYINLSLREWARAQHFPRDPEKSYCWVAKEPRMRVRKCKDSRMLDALRLDTPGTMKKPTNRAATPGALPGAAMVGLICGGKAVEKGLACRLGAQTMALTHGNVETFLCGGVIAQSISNILEDSQTPLKAHFEAAIAQMEQEFGAEHTQAGELAHFLRRSLAHAGQPEEDPRGYVEKLYCENAQECTAAAMYAASLWDTDFDSAMILSVNHSGRSAAVASLTGAFLGAAMGDQALPEFYLESLELAELLQTVAEDMALGSPTAGLFDDDWDRKYVQGLPVKKDERDFFG